MIQHATNGEESFSGKRVAISGSGNVAQYAALKVIELGGSVVSFSDSKGSMIVKEGVGSFTPEDIDVIMQVKVERKQLFSVAGTVNFSERFTYIDGARPWVHAGKVDVALPCATQNEVSGEEAKVLIEAGAKYVAEGSNMGCTFEAIEVFEDHRQSNKSGSAIWYGPGKAANCGGVAVSGLEMAQNSQRLSWTTQEVDDKLKGIMKQCFETALKTAEEFTKPGEGSLPSLVAGSNIAGFMKVAAAMKDQGDWW
jgi:glutamate dehydrogenase (NADP+)